jgi:hypothetical protein
MPDSAARSVYPAVCFRTPSLEVLGNGTLVDHSALKEKQQEFAPVGLNTNQQEALGRLLTFLLCGEESAVLVFFREGRRIRHKAESAAKELMWQIAGEEKVHELMIGAVQSQLPDTEDMAAIRQRSHDFFVSMASTDPALHFARVAGLDSGVCKIMAALCKARPVINCPNVHKVFSKVRSDEARHVRISRRYVLDLGLPVAALSSAGETICSELVSLLEPAGGALETVGVDAMRLFRHIQREET